MFRFSINILCRKENCVVSKMTRKEIRALSKEELFELSLKRGVRTKCYTDAALYAQKLLYTEMFDHNEIPKESSPSDYDYFDSDDYS